MRLALSAVLSLLGLAGLSAARSSTGDRVLVILEPQLAKDDYSKFWASLKGESSTSCNASMIH
jgi:oligosaccharyltransferase complex subunit beta